MRDSLNKQVKAVRDWYKEKTKYWLPGWGFFAVWLVFAIIGIGGIFVFVVLQTFFPHIWPG